LNVWLNTEDCHSLFSKIQDGIKRNEIFNCITMI
jgi:hypothetical protein